MYVSFSSTSCCSTESQICEYLRLMLDCLLACLLPSFLPSFDVESECEARSRTKKSRGDFFIFFIFFYIFIFSSSLTKHGNDPAGLSYVRISHDRIETIPARVQSCRYICTLIFCTLHEQIFQNTNKSTMHCLESYSILNQLLSV